MKRSLHARLIVPFLLSCAVPLGCGDERVALVESSVEIGRFEPVAGASSHARGFSTRAFDRSLWLFGETTLAQADAEGSQARASTWATTLDIFAQDGLAGFETPVDAAGGPAELLVKTAEELEFEGSGRGEGAKVWLEPLGLSRDSGSGQVLLFYSKAREARGGRVAVGSGVAVWSEIELGPQRPVLDASAQEPTLLFAAPEPAYGQAAVIMDGWVHVFGCVDRQVEEPCTLARVPTEAAFERSAWRFWDGRGWSEALDEAATVFESGGPLSVHFNPFVDRWLVIDGDLEGASPAVRVRSAPALTGPWSAPERVLELEPGSRNAQGHGELRREGGALEYVSYQAPVSAGEELRLVELRLSAEWVPAL